MPRWWYIFPALLASAGIIFAVWAIERAHRDAHAILHQGDIPGEFAAAFDEPGDIILFNEIISRRDGQLMESDDQTGLWVRVRGPDGTILSPQRADDIGDYKINGTRGIAVAQYFLPAPGEVRVEAFYREGNEATLGTLAVARHELIGQVKAPKWPLPFAGLFVIIAIAMSGAICHSRIRVLVDHESRAVPTMSSTTLPAPIWRRALATLIDLGVIIGLMMICSPLLVPLFDTMTSSTSIGIRVGIFAGVLAVLLAYYVLPEAKLGGTPGKFIMSLRTVTAEGRRLGVERSVVRNLLRLVDLLPFCYFVGGITHLMSKDNRRIGDYAADTLVVVR